MTPFSIGVLEAILSQGKETFVGYNSDLTRLFVFRKVLLNILTQRATQILFRRPPAKVDLINKQLHDKKLNKSFLQNKTVWCGLSHQAADCTGCSLQVLFELLFSHVCISVFCSSLIAFSLSYSYYRLLCFVGSYACIFPRSETESWTVFLPGRHNFDYRKAWHVDSTKPSALPVQSIEIKHFIAETIINISKSPRFWEKKMEKLFCVLSLICG